MTVGNMKRNTIKSETPNEEKFLIQLKRERGCGSNKYAS